MGLKIKAGMALTGLVLSWCFGLNGLSGVASYVDSTGNILVDIADGIGLVSKGIEALENYLEGKPASSPSPDPGNDPTKQKADDSTLVNDASQATPTPTLPPTPAPPQPVICRKGRCAPYDPSKDRVLQAQLIRAERERILQQVRSGELPADTVIPKRYNDDDFDDDDAIRVRRVKVPKKAQSTPKPSPTAPKGLAEEPPERSSVEPQKTPADEHPNIVVPIRRGSVDILDPHDPNPLGGETNHSEESPNTLTDSKESDTELQESKPSRWRVGFKKILGSLAGMTSKLNTLLLKVVSTIFPWNRRAKKRLARGDDEEQQITHVQMAIPETPQMGFDSTKDLRNCPTSIGPNTQRELDESGEICVTRSRLPNSIRRGRSFGRETGQFPRASVNSSVDRIHCHRYDNLTGVEFPPQIMNLCLLDNERSLMII
eukprot:maker-scaffold221_size251850-snap-gene-1.9 protein:Tk12501 transcript:maker-scaffold221_size251850-snap-gene-1.9-mRNA-1 annotation:"hypothetical protein"